MGYSYDQRGRLACDACGAAEGKTRKRTCPHKVRYADGGSLPYCYPSALCPTCYAKHKTTLHADCAAGAARSTAREDERRARFAAGEYERQTAWGSWHALVPEGKVGVCFVNIERREEYRLLPYDGYDAGRWLSEYDNAEPWPVHP